MIEAIVFDMDGLMFDTERMYYHAWDYAGNQMGIGGLGYYSLSTMGKTSASVVADIQRDFGCDPIEFLEHVKNFKVDFFSNNAVPVKKGLYELLQYLKENGYKMGIASSSPYTEICHNIQDAGVEDYFSVIVSGDMVKHSKPAPDPFALASERLGVAPSKCIALEDSNNGIRSAYAAGLLPVMIPDLAEPEDTVRPLLYAKLPDLFAVVDLLEGKDISMIACN